MHGLSTFGRPAVTSRLSAPAGHLTHQSVLFWDAEELLAPGAPRFSPPLAQDRGVVVVRGHLPARHLGVAGGSALAQGEGLLGRQQVGAPVEETRGMKEAETINHVANLCVTHCDAFLLSR